MWLYALGVLGRYEPAYRNKGIALARAIHRRFVVPGRGVIWKMKDDLRDLIAATASAPLMRSTATSPIGSSMNKRWLRRSPR